MSAVTFNPATFVGNSPRPLPVVLLLDVSGSMLADDKIVHLNDAVRTMVENFANTKQMETEIQVAIITFGSAVRQLFPPTPAGQVQWVDMTAGGSTPMGKAFAAAKVMIEDKTLIPGRAYRPVIVLVSDGQPTDDWEEPLAILIGEGRSRKCDRMALGIGNDVDVTMLERFVEGCTFPPLQAGAAEEIHKFFRLVTMSVVTRTVSRQPDVIPDKVTLAVRADDDDDLLSSIL